MRQTKEMYFSEYWTIILQHLLAHILGIFTSALQNSMVELIQSNEALMKADSKIEKTATSICLKSEQKQNATIIISARQN